MEDHGLIKAQVIAHSAMAEVLTQEFDVGWADGHALAVRLVGSLADATPPVELVLLSEPGSAPAGTDPTPGPDRAAPTTREVWRAYAALSVQDMARLFSIKELRKARRRARKAIRELKRVRKGV